MVKRKLGLHLNKRLMFGSRFFLELKSLNAVIQLFYLSRGLDLGQIVYLSLVWTATTFLCDLPSSYLADKFGRKRLIITGILLSAISILMLFWGNGFLYFSLTYIIGAAGYSFFMGADHAILYDSLKELGEEKNASGVSGKYFSAQSLPKIVMPFLGSFIARDLLPWQFALLISIDLIGSIFSIMMASQLTEPKVESRPIKKMNIIKEGFDLIKNDKVLLKLALNKIIIFQAAFVYWRIYQVFLKNVGMPTVVLGLVYTVFQTFLFLALWNTEKVQAFVGKINFANSSALIGLFAIVISLLSSNLYIIFSMCILLLIVGTIRDPFFLSQMQTRIPSFNRATATSTLNTIKNLSDIPLLLVVGYLAKISVNYVLIISGIMFAIAILFMRIKKEDLSI